MEYNTVQLIEVESLKDVEVVGVMYLDRQRKCLNCGSKGDITHDPEIGTCTKCRMMQSWNV